ncbi:MICOS complex subunit mic60 [Sphaceloma murrayae]|uniref:MICOS complex subunit MIC60 n=1 Tax=Sphaceloma murrayae TaxID=2082308 RepID=A0A2K1R3B3_9PEZI|nr:MICOS complex subunit mic60 [Sphaceloma murrayae]
MLIQGNEVLKRREERGRKRWRPVRSFAVSSEQKLKLSKDDVFNPPRHVAHSFIDQSQPVMLRAPLTRSRLVTCRPIGGLLTSQWHASQPRYFADIRRPDQTVLPGSDSKIASPSTPAPPTLPPTSTLSQPTPVIPQTPPTPEEVQSKIPSDNVAGVPTGPGTASIASSSPPAPKRKSRFRRFLTSLLVLSILGYGGGVYYSLVSDNFHDFFTEYVPFGEDAVAYFEEREFQKRFPKRPAETKAYPQIRGENKITIGKRSGLSAKVAEDGKESDLAKPGRHTSAIEDNVKPSPAPQAAPKDQPKEKKTEATSAKAPAKVDAAPASNPVPAATSLVDHVAVPEASEPVVQSTVKMLNDLITVINSDPNASKYQTTIQKAKEQLGDIVSNISTLKQQIQHDAEQKITSAHRDFDSAAKELVSRLEREMQEQELRWREEYESEREKISKSYQGKLGAEIESLRKLADQRTQTALLEQQIALNREFARQVEARVEAERQGRLGKLGELSSSVSELEKLTAEWNSVIDTNLQTQHLHVALDAVKSAIEKYDHPTPFVAELAALKEVGNSNQVVNAAIASIPPVAYQRGLPTSAHLIDRFRRVASEVRKAALLPEDAGVASHAASAVLSRFMFSKKGEGMPEGTDVEAVLTRTENLLEEGDLDGAAREMNGLHGWAGVLSKDWVGECRRVLETRQALEVIAAEARLQSLLVE